MLPESSSSDPEIKKIYLTLSEDSFFHTTSELTIPKIKIHFLWVKDIISRRFTFILIIQNRTSFPQGREYFSYGADNCYPTARI